MNASLKKLSVKHTILLVCVLLCAIFLVYLKAREYLLPKTVLTFGGVKIVVEIADTPISRTRGLGGHTPLAENQGMLFLFPQADRHQFWMKDMKFPLDIVWLQNGRVVDIAPRVPVSTTADLPVYTPRLPATSVLELKAGFTERHGVKIGDTASLLTK